METDEEAILGIARELEALRAEYPQLAAFSARRHCDPAGRVISYQHRTREPDRRAGWAGATPAPEPDGLWMYIDLHGPGSLAQIHTQPVGVGLHRGGLEVTLLLREGEHTRSIAPALHDILARHGIRPAGADPLEQRLESGVDLEDADATLEAALRALSDEADRRREAGEAPAWLLETLAPRVARAVYRHPALSGPAHAAGAAELARRLAALADRLGLDPTALDLADVERRAADSEPYPSLDEAARGYRPKGSPDTVADYRPRLAETLAALPAARLETLPALLAAFERWTLDAVANPGTLRDVNPALGRFTAEYVPSDAELIAAELGDRLRAMVAETPATQVRAAAGPHAGHRLAYARFDFDHTDVMGAGRFVRSSHPLAAEVVLP